jgi:hypothetical protein
VRDQFLQNKTFVIPWTAHGYYVCHLCQQVAGLCAHYSSIAPPISAIFRASAAGGAPYIQAMFMFNKTNAVPRSRQSSIDSPVPGISPSTSISTSTSTAASTVDAWASQGSDATSFGDMPSPEQRTRARSGKRSSVFNLRSRSNTVSSTTSFGSLVPPGMAGSDTSSHSPSRDYRHLAGQSFMELPGSKRSLFRGRKGKRVSDQFSPSFGVDEIEKVESVSKRDSVLRKGRRIMNHSEDSRKLPIPLALLSYFTNEFSSPPKEPHFQPFRFPARDPYRSTPYCCLGASIRRRSQFSKFLLREPCSAAIQVCLRFGSLLSYIGPEPIMSWVARLWQISSNDQICRKLLPT